MIKVPLKGTYNLMPYKIDPKAPAMKNYRQLPEGMPAEVIDNTLYVMECVPPSYYHADIAFELAHSLNDYVRKRKLGKVFQELGLFRKGSVVAPDVSFVSNKNLRFVEHKGLVGPADLCIEVLSPSTRKYNFTTKKKIYEKFGVKEYWLVDPITKDANGFLLEGKKYGDPLIMKGKINIRILNKTIKF